MEKDTKILGLNQVQIAAIIDALLNGGDPMQVEMAKERAAYFLMDNEDKKRLERAKAVKRNFDDAWV